MLAFPTDGAHLRIRGETAQVRSAVGEAARLQGCVLVAPA